MLRTALTLASLALTSPWTHAQSSGEWILDVLLLEGQSQPGLGTLFSTPGVSLNEQGDWAAHTILAPGGPFFLRAAVVNGQPLLVEGDPLQQPFGSMLGTLNASAFAFGPALDERGDLFWNGTYVPAGGFPVACIGRNQSVLLEPFESELNPGGPVWVDFFAVQVHGEGELLVGGRISDPLAPFPFREVLARVEVDSSGQVVQSTVLAELEAQDPALPGVISDFSTWNTGFSIGAEGAFAWTGTLDVDGVNLEAVGRDGALLALEEAPAGALGDWLSFDPSGTALAPTGSAAWRGLVLSTGPAQQVLSTVFVDGSPVWVTGEALPDHPNRAFTAPLVAPMTFAADGRLAVVLGWEEPGVGIGEALYLGDEAVIGVGDTTVEGHVIDQLFEGYRAMDGREDGAAFIVNARTTQGDNGLFRARRAGQVEVLLGCSTPDVELRASDGGPQLGDPLALEVQSADPVAAVFLGIGPPGVGPTSPCGPFFPGIGELLLDPLQFSLLSLGSPGPQGQFAVDVPFDAQLVGGTTTLQALTVDASAVAQLTNALAITIGG